MSGEYALLRPDTVTRICNDGHELITMGDKPSFDGSADEVKADIAASLNSIYNACGTAPSMYYSGRRDTAVSQKAASQMGLTHVQCTVDLRCASGNADDITERGLNKPIIGSIILMQPTGEAAKALDGLILGFERKGITVGTVSDVLAQDW